MGYWLLLGLVAATPIVMAQTMIRETEVKTFLTELEQSFNKKDIKTYGNTLASQFKVILHLSPTDKATYNRQDYLDLLGQGFKESPNRKTKYAITSSDILPTLTRSGRGSGSPKIALRYSCPTPLI